MKPKIYYDNISYRIKESGRILKLIEKVIRKERKTPGDLSFIITTDKELQKINLEFLGRNTMTDVIAFDYSDKTKINGEIYISKETVNRNALNYKISLKEEMLRIFVHGTLHLCGLSDDNIRERKKMSEEEDFWLGEFRKKN